MKKLTQLILILCIISSSAFALDQITLWVKVTDWQNPLASNDKTKIKHKLAQLTGTPWTEIAEGMVVWVDSATNRYYVTNFVRGEKTVTLAQIRAWATANLDYPNKINWGKGESLTVLINAGLTPEGGTE
jgi:hypothetical protein